MVNNIFVVFCVPRPCGADAFALKPCFTDDDVNATSCDGRITCSDYSDECRPECWNLPEYCRFGASDVESCQLADNSSLPTEPLISFSQVCDGNLNCTKTGADEAYCLTSTHFYCWSE